MAGDVSQLAMSYKRPGADPDRSVDQVVLFSMDGEVEACAIVGTLQESGVVPEEIVVVGFKTVTVWVARGDFERGRQVLARLRGTLPTVDWDGVTMGAGQ